MTHHVVIGAGASGLYTAYRLLTAGTLKPGDTVQVYEAGERPGGRIYSYTFPPPVGSHGLYAELGGMRFAVDRKVFPLPEVPPPTPAVIVEGHVLVQNMILELGLGKRVVPFLESETQDGNPNSGRMYYLRGTTVYENSLGTLDALKALPYRFSQDFWQYVKAASPKTLQPPYTSDSLLAAIASDYAPGVGGLNGDRKAWCKYFAQGQVLKAGATAVYPAGTPVRDIGYWNLLYDRFGDEGFDYAADGAGYTSNVINWNAADAMQANNDYGSGVAYCRLDGGFGQLFAKLAAAVESLARAWPGSGIFYGHTCVRLAESANGRTACSFSTPAGPKEVMADELFLAMPRKALELVAAGCAPGYVLNRDEVQYLLQSSIDQPAIKVLLVFDKPWWTDESLCTRRPCLTNPRPGDPSVPPGQYVGGPTITDLPLRQIYYFANNVPGGPGVSGGPYVLLASYDDENYSDFWRVLETDGDYTRAPSRIDQPLHGPTAVPATSRMAAMLMKQLAEVHGADIAQLPTPRAVYYQDWGQNPFGAGYHGWAPHYDICDAMDRIRAPYAKVLNDARYRTYIVGSCYSFDQAWVEGAFCVAESVLQEFLHLNPFRDVQNYWLVCRTGQFTPGEAA